MPLEFRAIGKEFPGVKALEDVSFAVGEGSVHALMGENGAGKSTLLKILSGAYRADSGQIFLNGQSVSFATPVAALEAGVAVIYQELHLVPEMTVAENLFLGHYPASGGWIKRSELRQRAVEIIGRIGEQIDPDMKVGSLSLAQRQMVEIGKALSRNAQVIAFDEPTSALSAREVERLFEIIADLRLQGKIILYVSHRMDEIFRVCDALTVLRDGKHIETFKSLEGVQPGVIVERMVGRTIDDIWGYRPRAQGEVVFDAKGITGPGLAAPQDIQVRAGEIVGVFGLVGAGRTELLKALYRGVPGCGGQIDIAGKPVRAGQPRDSIAAGIALCPEDRKKEGIVGLRSVLENTNLSARRNHALGGVVIDERWERSNAQTQVDKLRVRTPSLQQPIGLLSGGNQQKVILGRWLSESVQVLLLDEPTRGIDVGAKREIYELMYALAETGVGIIMVSSELPEVLGVSDRILVMRQGKLAAEVRREDATEAGVLALALPVAEEAA
jgi:L-arabinose transport system ATP-binding protein